MCFQRKINLLSNLFFFFLFSDVGNRALDSVVELGVAKEGKNTGSNCNSVTFIHAVFIKTFYHRSSKMLIIFYHYKKSNVPEILISQSPNHISLTLLLTSRPDKLHALMSQIMCSISVSDFCFDQHELYIPRVVSVTNTLCFTLKRMNLNSFSQKTYVISGKRAR